jgi:hypothetical protein
MPCFVAGAEEMKMLRRIPPVPQNLRVLLVNENDIRDPEAQLDALRHATLLTHFDTRRNPVTATLNCKPPVFSREAAYVGAEFEHPQLRPSPMICIHLFFFWGGWGGGLLQYFRIAYILPTER